MQILILLLHVTHILAGVFWAGASWLLAGWVTPAVELSGPAGQMFMQTIVRKRRLSDWLPLAALLSILSGLYLFWVASSGLRPGWFRTGLGLSLTIGALAGIATFLISMTVNRPSATRLSELGGQCASRRRAARSRDCVRNRDGFRTVESGRHLGRRSAGAFGFGDGRRRTAVVLAQVGRCSAMNPFRIVFNSSVFL